jgi:hypothetical protein
VEKIILMTKITLEVIPKPKINTRYIVRLDPDDTPPKIIRGCGNLDLFCGCCGAVLAKSLETSLIQNMVLFCIRCGSYNNIP